MGDTSASSLQRLKPAVEYAKASGVYADDYLALAKATKDNIDKVQLNQLTDWLATGRLRKVSDDVFESPSSGLQYTVNTAREGHVFAHVLKHNVDDVTKATPHGVFRGDIMNHIDDVWNRRAPQYQVSRPDSRIQYDVPVAPDVGYVGGQPGAASGFPDATHVTIVVEADGKTLVTAYPIKK